MARGLMVGVLFAALSAAGGQNAHRCQAASLLEDVVCGTSGSDPRAFTVAGDLAFFTAQDAEHGRELWRTDGTPAGTRLVKDIVPGPEGSEPEALVSLQGQLFFTVGTLFQRRALWRSDGTPEGTFPILELPSPVGFGQLQDLTVFQGALFFTMSDPAHGNELWRSDGTAAGTALFEDLRPGSASSSPRSLTVVGPWLYFVVTSPSGGSEFPRPELWRSDGTPEGTAFVAGSFPMSGDIAPQLGAFTAVGNLLFFLVIQNDIDNSVTYGLWRTDGTASGTGVLKQVTRSVDMPEQVSISGLTAVGGTLFFSAFEPGTGQELWKSNGTASGTVLVEDILPGPGSSAPARLTAVGRRLYFSAYEPVHGLELWRSDGSRPGTLLVKDIAPGVPGSSPSFLKQVDGTLFYAANAGPRGFELWRSDETGTRRLNVLSQGALSSSPHEFIALGGKILFAALGRTAGVEPWAMPRGCASPHLAPEQEEEEPGLQPEPELEEESGLEEQVPGMKCEGRCRSPVSTVQDIAPGREGSYGFGQAKVGGRLFFVAVEPSSGGELWLTQGTASGTRLVKDIVPGPRSSSPADLTPAGGLLYFTASDEVRGRALWKSDGTAGGTVPVEGTPEDFVLKLRAAGRYLFFSTFSGLWRTDGTAAGTLRLTGSFSEPLTAVGNTLYFAVSSPPEQAGLWRTDGTLAGTRRVAPVSPVLSATAVGGRLFFAAEDTAHGLELWTSDGTAAGTHLVEDIHPGPAGSLPFGSSMTALGTRLFFFADDGVHGLEPWVSDGTEAGTHLVEELFPGAEGANFVELVGGDRQAFFRILRFGEREVLWRSDGTAAGTFVVACVGAFNLTLIDGVLFFNGDDYTGAGSEPWRSDGTTAGTWRLQDLAPGAAYTSTLGFTRLGSKILFFAEDGSTGLEPWSVPFHSRGDGAPPPAVTCPASASASSLASSRWAPMRWGK